MIAIGSRWATIALVAIQVMACSGDRPPSSPADTGLADTGLRDAGDTGASCPGCFTGNVCQAGNLPAACGLGGGACHMGYRSCFFRKKAKQDWQIVGKKTFKPEEVYTRKG